MLLTVLILMYILHKFVSPSWVPGLPGLQDLAVVSRNQHPSSGNYRAQLYRLKKTTTLQDYIVLENIIQYKIAIASDLATLYGWQSYHQGLRNWVLQCPGASWGISPGCCRPPAGWLQDRMELQISVRGSAYVAEHQYTIFAYFLKSTHPTCTSVAVWSSIMGLRTQKLLPTISSPVTSEFGAEEPS